MKEEWCHCVALENLGVPFALLQAAVRVVVGQETEQKRSCPIPWYNTALHSFSAKFLDTSPSIFPSRATHSKKLGEEEGTRFILGPETERKGLERGISSPQRLMAG